MSTVHVEHWAYYGSVYAPRIPSGVFPLFRDWMWSGAGSNRRPSAFQVNRAKRCADLRKRTSLGSGTALGGRCNFDASRTRCTRPPGRTATRHRTIATRHDQIVSAVRSVRTVIA
jgi:hypothetical protein